jgi:hypothetical protein
LLARFFCCNRRLHKLGIISMIVGLSPQLHSVRS